MMIELTALGRLVPPLAARLRAARRDQRGTITEQAIITAMLVGLALAVMGVIVAKVMAKANSIPLE